MLYKAVVKSDKKSSVRDGLYGWMPNGTAHFSVLTNNRQNIRVYKDMYVELSLQRGLIFDSEESSVLRVICRDSKNGQKLEILHRVRFYSE